MSVPISNAAAWKPGNGPPELRDSARYELASMTTSAAPATTASQRNRFIRREVSRARRHQRGMRLLCVGVGDAGGSAIRCKVTTDLLPVCKGLSAE